MIKICVILALAHLSAALLSDCHWIGESSGTDEWCADNCNANPPNCPLESCTCSGAITTKGEHTVLVLNQVLSTFSLLGGLFIIGCYWAFPDLRSFAYWLVFMVGISDVFQALANMFADPATLSTCRFQAWMVSYFGLSSLMWQTSIAFTLYKAFLKGDERFNNENISRHKNMYLAVCWGIPAIMTVIFAGTYGDAYGVCWIESRYWGWRMVQFYIPLWCAVAFNVYTYYNMNKKLKAMAAPQEVLQRLKYYPLVLVVSWGPDSMVVLIELMNGNNEIGWLAAIAVICSALEGLFNAIVYGMTDDVKESIRSKWCGQRPEKAPLVAGNPSLDGVFSEEPLPDVYREEIEDNEYGASARAEI